MSYHRPDSSTSVDDSVEEGKAAANFLIHMGDVRCAFSIIHGFWERNCYTEARRGLEFYKETIYTLLAAKDEKLK